MKKDILSKMGMNRTTPAQFTADRKYDEVYGLYTYRGDVYVFKEGMDIPFDEITEKEQKEVHAFIMADKFVYNAALQ